MCIRDRLARSGAELLVMDREEERVREMRELTENALVVNTLDKKDVYKRQEWE